METEKKKPLMETKVAACMIYSDLAVIASEVDWLLNSGADWLHLDIMDGHFVPKLSIGALVVETLRKQTEAYLDCHLMVTNPLDYVETLRRAGASGFTFHVEASKDNWRELIQSIKAKGMRPGVALKPETPVEEVYPLVEDENPVEMVLVMTSEDEFSPLMREMLDKVRALRERYPSLDIQVDGGLGPGNIELVANAGANFIVAGIAVFLTPEPDEILSYYKKVLEETHQIRSSEETTKVEEEIAKVGPNLAKGRVELLERQRDEAAAEADSERLVHALSEMIKYYKTAIPV